MDARSPLARAAHGHLGAATEGRCLIHGQVCRLGLDRWPLGLHRCQSRVGNADVTRLHLGEATDVSPDVGVTGRALVDGFADAFDLGARMSSSTCCNLASARFAALSCHSRRITSASV